LKKTSKLAISLPYAVRADDSFPRMDPDHVFHAVGKALEKDSSGWSAVTDKYLVNLDSDKVEFKFNLK
jgi:hypothetical protein